MSNDKGQFALSVVMPALNEENNVISAIERTLSAFDHLGINGEIVVVNDGSTDNTGNLVEKRAEQEARVRMIVHETPQGIGGSFWDGVNVAGGDVVTMFPGDDENEPIEALRYFHLFENVDIVVPFISNKGVRSKGRERLSSLFTAIVNITFRTRLNYTNGTVLYRRAILGDLELRSKGFFYQTELLIKAIKRGYLFAEVPNLLRKRSSGVSKAVSFKSFYAVVKGYLQLVMDVYFKGTGLSGQKHIATESVTFQRLN
ncbi:MAG: glycosyltransferase family 2 protein [Deltaproteobacteria bacterium]|nr:glycosyltransferase family 2 protein [Deltaproteobacteria bacterium]